MGFHLEDNTFASYYHKQSWWQKLKWRFGFNKTSATTYTQKSNKIK